MTARGKLDLCRTTKTNLIRSYELLQAQHADAVNRNRQYSMDINKLRTKLEEYERAVSNEKSELNYLKTEYDKMLVEVNRLRRIERKQNKQFAKV